ncbi:hypothetical protein FRC03_012328 [Tulasnella sp. 419]|nr:hypothetical protein FRC03_012328 [Tulasnella sp. 419]
MIDLERLPRYGSPTTSLIKRTLDSYPAGAAVLRELLQNSDDSKATKQTFLLDKRQHETAGIEPLELSKYQGPALLAINDSEFKEQDWPAILTIQESSKVADETTAGKFGLGFLACYHVSAVLLAENWLIDCFLFFEFRNRLLRGLKYTRAIRCLFWILMKRYQMRRIE